MQTYTPSGGNSPQALQSSALQGTLKSLGPLPQPAQNTANAAITSVQNTGQTLAQAPQVMQQTGQTLASNANFGAINQGMSDAQKQYALFLHDMQQSQNVPGVATPPPTNTPPPTTATGASALTPDMIGDPLAYGNQMGQANPYGGLKYAYGAEGDALSSALQLLTSANSQNVGQMGSTLGQVRDLFQSQRDQQKSALDVLTSVISAAQNEREQRRQDYLAGLIPGQNNEEQVKKLADQVRTGKMSPEYAAQLAAANPALKIAYEREMASGGQGLGASPVPAGLSPVIAGNAKTLLQKIDQGGLDVGRGVFGLGRGKDDALLLETLQAMHPTMKSSDLEGNYLPGILQNKNDFVSRIRSALETINNVNPDPYSAPSHTSSGDWTL